MSAAAGKICVLTGGNGFVGSRLRAALERDGWKVLPWTRKPRESSEAGYELGNPVDASRFRDVDALVHCAYDFGPHRWPEIAQKNIAGAQRLFETARQAGVSRIVHISSLSAFDGCRSLYGKAKLETERLAARAGAHIIRPGLVYGEQPGGMFGRLAGQVKRSAVIPMLAGCRQIQYLVHEADLGALVTACVRGDVKLSAAPISVAHPKGWELREILNQMGAALGKRLTFVPVPWQFVWCALRFLETVGRPAKFRSDSLIGMVYQNPAPDFEVLKRLGYSCRQFQVAPEMLH